MKLEELFRGFANDIDEVVERIVADERRNARLDENRAVVAYLRREASCAEDGETFLSIVIRELAGAIERGEHRG